jgi:RNA polymerase sigma-70 factor (sigma-E family)
VRARGQALTRTAFLLTGDAGRAEDLVQSSLLALWLRHGRVARPAWENYVRRSVVNTSVSWWRRRSSSERPTDSPPETGMADPAGTVDERRRLIAALRLLPPRQRAAVVLRFYEDFSEAETARMLGCTIGNVKSLTSRGLDRLRLVLGAVDTPSGRTGPQRLAGRNDA